MHAQAVLSCCTVHGGEVVNVIPDTVKIGGTIRDLSPAMWELIEARFRTIVEHTCAAFGATASKIEFWGTYPVVDNHVTQTEAVRGVAARYLGAGRISEEGLPMLAGEDFSVYMKEKPGCFFFLGGNEVRRRAHVASDAAVRCGALAKSVMSEIQSNGFSLRRPRYGIGPNWARQGSAPTACATTLRLTSTTTSLLLLPPSGSASLRNGEAPSLRHS